MCGLTLVVVVVAAVAVVEGKEEISMCETYVYSSRMLYRRMQLEQSIDRTTSTIGVSTSLTRIRA